MNQPTNPTRPTMPESYGLHPADPNQFISWEWVSTQLAQSRNYWIATVTPDNRPHLTPVWGIWLDEKFYFGTDANGRKARNLAHNPALTVHLESGDDTVILEGTAHKNDNPDLIGRLNAAYITKYAVDVNLTWVFELHPTKILAWLESDFPRTATRWHIPR